jgi:hypothetical protein
MNERIKELERQAEKFVMSIPASLDINEYTLVFNEKFAELIVKEMLVTCEEHPAWTGRMIGEQIKQHFGVEE